MQKYCEARIHMPESCPSIRRRRKNCPGVRAVATYKNTTECHFNSSCSEANPPAVPVEDEQVFNQELRYVGDEVAAVAADTGGDGKAGSKLIRVEYEELPAVFDPLEAMKPDAPPVHPCFIGNNIAGMAKLPMGDLEKGFGRAILSWKNGLNFLW